ncbi:MAG: LysR family transcriptional regulator [Alphaproteobacteria bacterium]
MDWDKLRIFHAVAKAGSLTHAGESLGLSQSAVSRQISALEDQLRVTLFHRHARGLSLTEQGDILFCAASDVHDRLLGAQAQVSDAGDKPCGDFRVTTTVSFGAIWLAPRLKAFTERYPDIRLELVLDDRELDLAGREADVALRLHAPAQPDLVARRLFQVPCHLYASGDYLQRRGIPRDESDLDHHAVILYANPPKHLMPVNWPAQAGRSGQPPRTPCMTVNSVIALAQMAEAGIGIASLPDYLCADKPRLVRVLPDAEVPRFDTFFVYPEELRQSKRVAVFRDFMLEQARGWTY